MSLTRGLLVALPVAASLLFPPAASAQDAQVVFERTGYRLTSLGARVSVSARVLDNRRRQVPNAPIAWRVQDPAIATVDVRGEVQSRRVGRTRIWAVSGRDSASALLLVDQWAAKFTFNPPALRLGAVGERRSLQVQARDAVGNVIAGIRSATVCRVLDERIATLSPNGQLLARASGVTYVRCADRGVSDSARVEVRQRPFYAQIPDKATFASRSVGETFQIRMRAADSANAEIADARPTWASLEPRVVSVDPLTGMARAVSPGDVKIVGQIGDLTDTVSIAVAGTGAPSPVVTAVVEPTAAESAEAARAVFNIDAPFPAVGDTAQITVTARDAAGAEAEPSSIALRVTDSTVVRLLRGNRLVALKQGSAHIVGTYGSMVDSALVSVRARGASLVEAEDAGNFVRPTFMDAAAARRRNQAQIDSARTAILRSSPIRTGSGRLIAVSALASQASHSVQVSDSITESRTGLLFGGRAALAPHRKLQLSGDFRLGTLAPGKDEQGEELTVTEAEGQLSFSPAAWFTLRGAFALRAQDTPIALQTWKFASIGGLTRLQFVGGKVSTIAGLSLIPWSEMARSDTTLTADATSLAGEAGVAVQTGFLDLALLYYVERFTFPVLNGFQRKEQFSAVRLRLGLKAGG